MRRIAGAMLGAAALIAALVTGVTALPAAAAAERQLPVPYGFLPGPVTGLLTIGGDPPGANDWSCRPSAEHPNPVVLVHGFIFTGISNWQTISPLLSNEGYCVFSLDYGIPAGAPFPLDQFAGFTRMEDSAAHLDAFVDRVLGATGASRVDLVGYSEGTIMPQYWLQFLRGAARTDKFVAIGPLYDGTLGDPLPVDALARNSGLRPVLESAVALACASCPELVHGSAFLARMQQAGTRVPGVDYTTVVSRYDELVIPYTSGLLEGANNVVVQDGCEIDGSDHLSIIATERTGRIVLNALDPEHAGPLPCRPSAPVLGNELGLGGF